MSRSVAEQSAILPSHRAAALVKGRQFGVPRSMIDAAGERRRVGDWRGACRAAGFDVRLDPYRLRRRFGSDVVHELLDDLRHFGPDLLRWQMPRKAHGAGLLRADLRIPLAVYSTEPGGDSLMLAAVTTRPGLAAGERILLTTLPLTAGGRPAAKAGSTVAATGNPRLRNARRYRLDHHRFSWDTRQSGRLAALSGGPDFAAITRLQDQGQTESAWAAAGIKLSASAGELSRLAGAAVNLPQLVAEARRIRPGIDRVALFPGNGWAIILDGVTGSSVSAQCTSSEAARELPVLPLAGWSRPVDAELLRLRHLRAEQLHPLVAAALRPEACPVTSSEPTRVHDGLITVRCGNSDHRLIWHENGWQAVDHSADQLRRELRFGLLGGRLCGCLRELQSMTDEVGLAEEVDLYLHHGRVEQAWSVVRERLGSMTTLADIEVTGGTAIDAVTRLEEAALRYRLTLAGFPLWLSHPAFLLSASDRMNAPVARRRRTRKGAGQNKKVIR
jgi:hypothetical protein